MVVCVGDEFGVVLFLGEVGVGADGCGGVVLRGVVDESGEQLSQLTHFIFTTLSIYQAGRHI